MKFADQNLYQVETRAGMFWEEDAEDWEEDVQLVDMCKIIARKLVVDAIKVRHAETNWGATIAKDLKADAAQVLIPKPIAKRLVVFVLLPVKLPAAQIN